MGSKTYYCTASVVEQATSLLSKYLNRKREKFSTSRMLVVRSKLFSTSRMRVVQGKLVAYCTFGKQATYPTILE
jgi:hypothetical protein